MHVHRLFPLRATLLAGALLFALAACSEAPPLVAPPLDVAPPHPLVVPTVTTVVQVSAGENHTCVVKPNSELACWGRNYSGEASPPAGAFMQVSAGSRHTCGVRSDGTLSCWGQDVSGALNVPSGAFTQVSAGFDFACAVRSDGTIVCWGYDSHGQATPPSGAFSQVEVGDFHACAVASVGTIACWGHNFHGQATPPAGTFEQVSSGGSFSCGLETDATIVCWGSTADGRTSPPDGLFVRLAEGYALKHGCALGADGSVACWGKDTYGEATSPSGAYVQVSAGDNHSCAVKLDGSLTCWGSNADGQVSLPTTRVIPTASFAATPSSVPANGSFTLSLANAQVPGYPQATAFTYAFDCGDGSGYGVASLSASLTCTAQPAGLRTVRGKVIDQDGDAAEYSATVDVYLLTQAITFTSQPPSPALLRGTYPVSATGGDSGNPVVFSSLTPGVCTVAGSTVSLNTIGTCTVAADQAGDATYSPAPQVTQSVAIVYAFPGFSQPIDNLPTINLANAGQIVPLKFQLFDAAGAPVTTLTTATVTVTSLACSIGSAPNQLEEYAAGGSGLQNLGGGYYQFNWKTPKGYARSCKTMHLELGDGLTHEAAFQFK